MVEELGERSSGLVRKEWRIIANDAGRRLEVVELHQYGVHRADGDHVVAVLADASMRPVSAQGAGIVF